MLALFYIFAIIATASVTLLLVCLIEIHNNKLKKLGRAQSKKARLPIAKSKCTNCGALHFPGVKCEYCGALR